MQKSPRILVRKNAANPTLAPPLSPIAGQHRKPGQTLPQHDTSQPLARQANLTHVPFGQTPAKNVRHFGQTPAKRVRHFGQTLAKRVRHFGQTTATGDP
jgi:hypothetical protein